MKTSITSFALVLALGAFAAAQTSADPQSSPAPSQPGSAQAASPASNANAPVIGAILSKTVDAKKAKEGDEVVAKTLMEMKSADGTVIPISSKIIGHVTQVQARGKGQDKSVLAIAFDKIQAKDKELPFHAVIQAVAAPRPVASLATDSGTPAASSSGTGGASGAAGATGSYPNAHDTGTAGNVGSNAGADNASGAAPNPGDPGASLTASSQGAIGMKDVQLAPAVAGGASMLSSSSSNVKLESGTRFVLKLTPQ